MEFFRYLNKIYYFFFNKTVLIIAIEENNMDLINLLLSSPYVDVNVKIVYNCF